MKGYGILIKLSLGRSRMWEDNIRMDLWKISYDVRRRIEMPQRHV
jgi:hypothetical protein